MEQDNRKYNLRPLPGGRRGAPGAGAGCFSLRTTGGEELSRRAPVTQDATAGRQKLSRRAPDVEATAGRQKLSRRAPDVDATAGRQKLSRRAPDVEATAESIGDDTMSLFSSIPSTRPSYMTRRPSTMSSSNTSADVVQEVNSDLEHVPTTRNTTSTRKRWTLEMNKFILRTYFQLTALNTDTKSYLEPLHVKFSERFPDMQVSRQRVGDQRRAIVRNKLLPQSSIDEIYNAVKEELKNLERTISTQDIPTNTLTSSNTIHQTLTLNSQTLQTTAHNSQNTSRMRWTNEHNETIMRLYYKITQMDTNRTTYRKPLHEAFISSFPLLSHISEQRVSDQRRAIINNKYISDARLNIIKKQVEEELSINTDHTNIDTHETPVQNINNDSASTQFLSRIEINLPEETVNETQRNPQIDVLFDQTLQHFKNTDPTTRPFIPKQKTSKKFATIVDYLNSVILPENTNSDTDFSTLQTIIYCAAWTAAKNNGAKISTEPIDTYHTNKKDNKPRWQRRLERRLEYLRTNIGRLTQFINGNTSRKLEKQVECILEQYKIHSIHEEPNTHHTHTLDTLKQKLAVVTGRLRRYKACTLRKQQNNQFKNNEKQFYRNLRQTTTNTQENSNTDNTPDPKDLQTFWAGIWEHAEEHNTQAAWIQTEIETHRSTTAMKYDHIPIDTFQKVLQNLHNWKAPGSDNIHNYWYKKFTSIHGYLFNHLNQFIENPSIIPDYITLGTTIMITKDRNDPTNPAKYRPITCLQTVYKILTSCISELIYKHVDNSKILAEQQKGCRKLSQGCKEQLVIDSVILKQVQKLKSDLFSMYVDYRKAYDSVPHSWLIQVLEIYKIHPKIVAFLEIAMKSWRTNLKLITSTDTIQTETIKIQRGIFQGDTLSPLWFCLALNPLSNILNSTLLGYPLKYTDNGQTDRQLNINHLLYMDDIKLYASNENHLHELINLTEQFTNDIKMKFGIDKCKINSIKAGQTYRHSYTLETGEEIESLDEQQTYKYLGYNQSLQIQYKETKEKLKQVFRHKLHSIVKTQLHAGNIFKAINTYAIPILTYSFGIINWTKSDLKTLQRSINTTLTKSRKHHPRSCLQRLTLPRKEGGRGLIDILNLHNRQITNLRQYFHNKSETSTLHKAIEQNDHKATPLNLQDKTPQNNEKLIDDKTKLAEWAIKSLHGRHHHDLCQSNVDKNASNAWLSRGGLFPETEGFIMAIQDQVIETKNYQKFITKTLTHDICRKCNSCPETIQHITGACKSIAQTDYKYRHDQVANIIHQKLAHQQNFISSPVDPYYKYSPQTVLENSTTKLYFDRAILTDRTIHYNRPDITLINKTNKTGYLIDIAIPNTHNLQSTIAEKLMKYVELKDEITRIWHLQKVTIVPIVLSSTAVIPKQLHQSLKTLNLPPNTYHLMQKAVILNTCRIVRKFLQNEPDRTTLPQNNTLTSPIQTISNNSSAMHPTTQQTLPLQTLQTPSNTLTPIEQTTITYPDIHLT